METLESTKQRLLAAGVSEADTEVISKQVYGLIFARLFAGYVTSLPVEERKQLEALSQDEVMDQLIGHADKIHAFFEREEVIKEAEKLAEDTWNDYFATVLNTTA